ncbi:MAG: hypothetical protein KDC95_05730 [Planctomycetes bacterium]|nr:hypothetical protein [Planctomycetota bacterium]
MTTTLALVALVAASDIRAQTKTVFPSSLANREGESSTSLPFGYNGPARMQLVYQVAPPGSARSALLKEFAFRADGRKDVEFPAKKFVDCFVVIGYTNNEYSGLSTKFVDNRLGIGEQVFSGKLELPLQAKQATTAPRSFDLRFKLPRPWLHRDFDNGYLMIEIGIVNQPAGNWDMDIPFVCYSQGEDFGKIGPRCQFSDTTLKAPRQPILVNDTAVEIGGNATFTATNLPDNAPTLFVFGLSDKGTFAGGFLPRAMDDKIFPYPATDCFANTDWIELRFALAKNGTASASLPIPPNDVWRLVTFHCQTLTLDLAANPMGVVWSLGRRVQACGPVQCARVFSLGSYTVTSGIVQTGSAPVLELTY